MINADKIRELVRGGEGLNVDFKRNVPSKVRELTEEVCSFANAVGGFLLIGVTVQGEIVGCSIDNRKRSAIQLGFGEVSPRLSFEMYSVLVDGKEVWVVEVPMGRDKPYFLSGAIFVREGANSQKVTNVEEIRDFFKQSNKVFFDEEPMPRVDLLSELDEDNFVQFRRQSGLSPDVSAAQVLDNMQVFDDDGFARRGGVLFFARNPEKFFFHAVVRCVQFKGVDKVMILDDKTFGGPLLQQYTQAMAWIQSKLSVAYEISGTGPRREVWELPLSVFKEAIVNALSHRDYFEHGASITVEVFDDRVEVSNPGELLPLVARDFGRRSLSRNPLIFGLFNKMRLVEHIGSGIPRMRKDMLEAGLREPLFETNGMFTVSFFRRKHYTFEREEPLLQLSEPMSEYRRTPVVPDDGLNDNQRLILQILAVSPRLTLPEIGEKIGFGRTRTFQLIKDLQQRGFLRRRGRKADGEWVVVR